MCIKHLLIFKQHRTLWREETWSEMQTLATLPLKKKKKNPHLCRNVNNKIYAKVKIGKHLFSEFKVNKGVRQGDAIAPVLINVVLADCNLKI